MKKLLALILAAALALSLVACGGGSGAEDTNTPSTGNGDTPNGGGDSIPEDTGEPADYVEDDTRYQLGDTVSTDILELTVKKASLAYYAKGANTTTDGKNRTTNIDEAYEPADGSSYCFYKCNKGRVLVCLDFILKNTDRSSLNTTDGYNVEFVIRKDGDTFDVKGYALNYPDGILGLNYGHSSIAVNDGDFITNKTGNIIMKSGTAYEIKTVGIAGFEAEDLSASFELIATIKNSSGDTEEFFYSIE